MYLHIGQDTIVNTDEIIGIFDMDNTTVSKWTRRFLNTAEKHGQVVTVTTDLPKTFIVLSRQKKKRHIKNGDDKVYLSQMLPGTLRKRTGHKYHGSAI